MTQSVIRHCAPTLAGIKAGSLFSCAPEEAEQWVREMGDVLRKSELELALLWRCSERLLVYIYRPALLEADFANEAVRRILAPLEYRTDDVAACVDRLRERFAQRQGFPHEVGVFLGYPAADVQGFMEHGGRGYKCRGNWKVYGDELCARRMFARFRACTHNCMKRYQRGDSFAQLIAANGSTGS